MKLEVRTSANIEQGATTNRVRVQRRIQNRPPGFGDPPQVEPVQVKPERPSKGYYRKDPDRPVGHRQICISVQEGELAVVDARALELGLSRSRLLVIAAMTHAPVTPEEAELIALVRRMRR